MKVRGFFFARNTKNKYYVMEFTPEEFDDIHSCLGMALRETERLHRDSPLFRKAVHKLNRDWLSALKNIRNQEKQYENSQTRHTAT